MSIVKFMSSRKTIRAFMQDCGESPSKGETGLNTGPSAMKLASIDMSVSSSSNEKEAMVVEPRRASETSPASVVTRAKA